MSYRQASSAQLYDLCQALGLEDRAGRYLDVQSWLMDPWGTREVPPIAPYPSRIGDDHSPYEYSVQFSNLAVELRLLLEAQAEPPSLLANQAAASTLNARIVDQFQVDLSRFRLIEDLFCPSEPRGSFSLWHAVCFDPSGNPDFKLYTNPRAQTVDSNTALMMEAVSRLGLTEAAKPVMEAVSARGGIPNYFSLDLAVRLGSRVKLYFEHTDASVADLESIFASAPSNTPGDVTQFCQAIVQGVTRFSRKPVCYCFSFVEGTPHPISVTLHLPVAHYIESDALILNNVSRFMASRELPVREYQRAVAAMARRALGTASGLQSYVSFRKERGGLKFTVYLSPELFATPYGSGSALHGDGEDGRQSLKALSRT
jgi:DMATS type aromatic prenyltransferase